MFALSSPPGMDESGYAVRWPARVAAPQLPALPERAWPLRRAARCGCMSAGSANGAGAVGDVDLRVDELLHSYLGDLVVKLSHDGVTATVFDPADNFAAHDLVDLILDDEAGAALPTAGSGPVTGRYRPSVAGALAAFDGHPAAGTWTLTIADGAAG